MSHQTIVVAGASGDLGKRVVDALVECGADVVALVRPATSQTVKRDLTEIGARVRDTDMEDADDIAAACSGAQCVVSTLAGLREVLIETQSKVLAGALKAGVPRFIPSDFCTDFSTLTPGENRNFDLRREFHRILYNTGIAATSIFNGAFAEVLRYDIPLLNRKTRTVSYWGSADWKVDFTTMDDTAAFTARAALDEDAPRVLRIAGFQMSARDFVSFTETPPDCPYRLIELGTIEELRRMNMHDRALNPEGEHELYAGWQQSQYLQSMLSAHHEQVDNARFGERKWTALADLMKT